jgi:hypothetical protein
MEGFREATGRATFHAAQARQAHEDLIIEPVLRALGAEVGVEKLFLRSISALVVGRKTFGWPVSPSHFGISYSRIVWSRKVFQVSLDTSR